jgi:hypothetical protein
MQQQLFVMMGKDYHCGEPVHEVGHLVEGASLLALLDISDEVIKALVCAFLASDELDDLQMDLLCPECAHQSF